MPSLRSPTVFVSSTCYDLGEVRDQLRKLILDFAFDPLLSEFNSFPINPLDSTTEICKKNVEERADIFVLIVGRRYGSTDDSGRSITNIEYLQARAKGIPIYVFITRAVIELIPVWRDNPEAKFSGVDSPKLFEFVDSIRNVDRVWTFAFDKADDIISTLRNQWAFLFLDALNVWTKLRSTDEHIYLQGLSGNSLRLAIERPRFWEHRLFNEVLNWRLRSSRDARLDKDLRLSVGSHVPIANDEFLTWLRAHDHELKAKIETLNSLLGSDIQTEAFGPLGSPGNTEKIVYLANRIADVYSDVITLSLRCRRVAVDDCLSKLVDVIARMGDGVLAGIDDFAKNLKSEVDAIIDNPPSNGVPRHISLTLHVTLPDGIVQEREREFEKAMTALGFQL